jgi:hypothetical protein
VHQLFRNITLYQLHTKFDPTFSQGQLHMQTKLLWIICVEFNITKQLLCENLHLSDTDKWTSTSVIYKFQEVCV